MGNDLEQEVRSYCIELPNSDVRALGITQYGEKVRIAVYDHESHGLPLVYAELSHRKCAEIMVALGGCMGLQEEI